MSSQDNNLYNIDNDYDIVIKGNNKKITGRQALLSIPINSFFNKKDNLRKLIPILNGTSRISLRIIDWFVTNYCKENSTMFNKNKYSNKYKKSETKKSDNEKSDNEKFDDFIFVHTDYKSQLKSYNKKNFDPFCRRDRVNVYYNKNKYFSTTIGQLNFFKWAIENYIINYIDDNIDKIEKSMNQHIYDSDGEQKNDNDKVEIKINCKTLKKKDETSNEVTKKRKKRKKNSTKKKKNNLTQSNHKSMMRHHYPTIITFD